MENLGCGMCEREWGGEKVGEGEGERENLSPLILTKTALFYFIPRKAN